MKSKNIQFLIFLGLLLIIFFGAAKAIGSQHFFANTQQAFAYFKNKNPKNKIEEKILLKQIQKY